MIASTSNPVEGMLDDFRQTESPSSILPFEMDEPFGPKMPPGMNPVGQAADRDLPFLSWYELGAMSEALLRMFPPVQTAVDRLLTYVIGDGYNINPNTGDQKLDDDLEQYFLDFSSKEEQIDVDGQSDLKSVLWKLLRGAVVPGGHFVNFVSREHTGCVGMVQLIEAYRCKTPYGKDADDRIVGGVQLARNSRKQIGYWFEKDDVGDWGQYLTPGSDDSDYFEAEDESGEKQVIHFRLDSRSSATKSDGLFSCSCNATAQQLRLRKNVGTKAEIANAWSIVKGFDPQSENFKEWQNKYNRLVSENEQKWEMQRGVGFRPGQSILTPPGMTAKIESPNIPNDSYFTLDDVYTRELASRVWMSKELLTLDASTSNYSSIRMLMRASEPGFRWLQTRLAYGFLRHFWNFKLKDLAFEDGAVRRAIQRTKYNPHQAIWDYPGWRGLDPEKDFESDNDRMSNGHASESRVFQERGLNYSKEKPRIVADAMWGFELVSKIMELPETKRFVAASGLSKEDVFWSIYTRTTPNGVKSLEAVAKWKAANAAEMMARTNVAAASKTGSEPDEDQDEA